MKQNRSKDLRVRVIKNFTDILMLKYLKQNPKSSGYQILRSLHERYNILFSPGTIYNEIYALERKGFIASEADSKSGTAFLNVCDCYKPTIKVKNFKTKVA